MALRTAASFGAGAAAITASSALLGDPLGSLSAQLGWGGGGGADELARAMQRHVEGLEARLERVLAAAPAPGAAERGGAQVVVLRDGAGRARGEWLGLAAGAAGVWLVYCRLTGRRPLAPLAALLPVSRAALAQSCAAIDAGIRGVSDTVGRVRDRLHELTGRVDAGLEEQAAMRDELAGVAAEVKEMKDSVDAMHASVRECDEKLIEAAHQQDFANRGIQLLCSVVYDVIQPAGGANMLSSRERLRAFSQGGTQPALAEERATGTANLGLLLGGGAAARGGGGSGGAAPAALLPAPSDLAAGAPHAAGAPPSARDARADGAPPRAPAPSDASFGSQLRMLAQLGRSNVFGGGGGGDAGGGGAAGGYRGDRSDSEAEPGPPGGHMPGAQSGSSLSSATTDDD